MVRSRHLALVAGLLAAAVAVTCRSPVDPDKGRFSCESGNDCGSGYECIPQFSGGGLCFKQGQCITEECNGLDDNCEGRVDETFTSEGDVCQTGQSGPCNDGRNACIDAGVVCRTNYTPVAETCNSVDDDCVNGIDDGFGFSSNNMHCGGCNRVCGAGALCANFVCREVNCADGIDNNDDAGADCLDPDCITVSCGLDGGYNCGAQWVPSDAGPGDGGMEDGGMDAGEVDAGEMDAGEMDAGQMDAGEMDGGADAGETDGGELDGGDGMLVLACVPRESPCNNAADDDYDGRLDCADSDCDGKACDGGTCMTGTCR